MIRRRPIPSDFELLLTVPESKIERLRRAHRRYCEGMRKYPPAINEEKELRRAVVSVLKGARTIGKALAGDP